MSTPPDPRSLYLQITGTAVPDDPAIAAAQRAWNGNQPYLFLFYIASLLEPSYRDQLPVDLIEESKRQESFQPFLRWIHDQELATISSWSTDFKGTADATLMSIISGYLKVSHLCNGSYGSPYTNQAFLVNSSGTGKSRLVDQLGRNHCLVIPICLRLDDNTGYPPPDRELLDWLTRPGTATGQQAFTIAYSLLFGLFKVTHDRFKTIMHIQQQDRNAEFLRKMDNTNRATQFSTHSEYRNNFYKDVVECAKVFAEGLGAYPPEKNDDVREAAELLLKECKNTTIVISFDEPHILAFCHSQEWWTLFEAIRQAMRSVLQQNIFALYLTTAAEYRLMPAERKIDSSSRIIRKERLSFPPITEVGFNQLAEDLETISPLTLEFVTEPGYICHLGRPLWGSRWDAGNETIRQDIVDFAKYKLLGPANAPTGSQILACLAVRFAIQFRPTNEKQQELEVSLVKSYMRFCLKADTRSPLRTTAPSEPLLAEAAFEYLHYQRRDSFLEILAQNMDAWGIHLGDRGELVMMLIWMRARDLLVGTSEAPSRPWKPFRQGVISVNDFMKKLLPQGLSRDLDSMAPSMGTGSSSFSEAFADCRIWCNHFIEVQDYKVLQVNFLCALLSNGIGVLCAPNQTGIDLLWIGLRGTEILPENIVLILGQAKIDMTYNDKINRIVLDAMDPVNLGICTTEHPVPIIRIVFALASITEKAILVSPPERTSARQPKTASLTSYDFWFAGLGRAAFGCVEAEEVRHYRDILAACRPLYAIDDIIDTRQLGLPRMEEEDERNLEREFQEATLSTSGRVDRLREGNPFTMAEQCHFPALWQEILTQSWKEDGDEEDTGKRGVNDTDVDPED